MSDLKDQFFPVSTSMVDREGQVFENKIVGGISKRDFVAIELLKGIYSNPAFVSTGANAATLRRTAIREANLFLKELEEAPTETNKPTVGAGAIQ